MASPPKEARREARRERRPPEPAPKKGRAGWDLTLLGLYLLLLVPPFVFRTDTTDNFRLPKLQYTEGFAGLALALLVWRLADLPRIEWRELWARLRREPAILALLPLVAIAAVGALFAPHPERTTEALFSLLLAAIFLAGLALALSREERDRLLRLMCWPAAALAVLGILQFHDLIHPFGFQSESTERLQLTSLAGGAFDLSAYLLLPALFSLRELFRAEGRRGRTVWGLAAALFVYGIAVSQTLTVLIGLAAGVAILGFFCVRRYFWQVAGGLAALALLLVLVVPPLRGRVDHAAKAIADQDYNQLLSGRLDGWRVAGRMLADHPLAGVGHGAFRSEFGDTKLELADQGVEFFLGHRGAYFTNAHNDLLEVGAELGWPGLLAACWGIWLVLRQALRRKAAGAPADLVGFELGMLAAMFLVALANFPFHLALVVYPWLIFLSGLLAKDGLGLPEPPAEVSR